MTIQERADIAANLKESGQCNCCQAVTKVLAFGEVTGGGFVSKIA